jgi:[ribosomal protein S18]-alanine N-acetyltransferase
MLSSLHAVFPRKISTGKSQTDLVIRVASAADIPFITTLEKNTTTAAHWTEPQYQQIFSESGLRRVALIIEEGKEAQGFLFARAIDKEWELENIVVAGSARRRGLGGYLLQSLIHLAQQEEAEVIFLEVRKSNRAAQSLYGKLGFLELGNRANYYTQPVEDAISYRLSLL